MLAIKKGICLSLQIPWLLLLLRWPSSRGAGADVLVQPARAPHGDPPVTIAGGGASPRSLAHLPDTPMAWGGHTSAASQVCALSQRPSTAKSICIQTVATLSTTRHSSPGTRHPADKLEASNDIRTSTHTVQLSTAA